MELVAAYARTERSTENESAPTLATPARNFRAHAVGEPGSVVLFLFRMPTYYISLAISRSASLNDEALIRLFREAAVAAGGVPIEVTPAGLVIDGDPASIDALKTSLSDRVREQGGHIDRITFTRI